MATSTMKCQLCIKDCTKYEKLYTNGSEPTRLFNIVVNFFHPMFLQIRRGFNDSVVCADCWNIIYHFHKFQNYIISCQQRLTQYEQELQKNDANKNHLKRVGNISEEIRCKRKSIELINGLVNNKNISIDLCEEDNNTNIISHNQPMPQANAYHPATENGQNILNCSDNSTHNSNINTSLHILNNNKAVDRTQTLPDSDRLSSSFNTNSICDTFSTNQNNTNHTTCNSNIYHDNFSNLNTGESNTIGSCSSVAQSPSNANAIENSVVPVISSTYSLTTSYGASTPSKELNSPNETFQEVVPYNNEVSGVSSNQTYNSITNPHITCDNQNASTCEEPNSRDHSITNILCPSYNNTSNNEMSANITDGSTTNTIQMPEFLNHPPNDVIDNNNPSIASSSESHNSPASIFGNLSTPEDLSSDMEFMNEDIPNNAAGHIADNIRSVGPSEDVISILSDESDEECEEPIGIVIGGDFSDDDGVSNEKSPETVDLNNEQNVSSSSTAYETNVEDIPTPFGRNEMSTYAKFALGKTNGNQEFHHEFYTNSPNNIDIQLNSNAYRQHLDYMVTETDSCGNVTHLACSICHDRFPDECHLKHHFIRKHFLKSHLVQKSLDNGRLSQELDEFIARYYPTIRCPVCESQHKNFSSFENHFHLQHPQAKEGIYISCCEEKIPDRVSLLQHICWHLDPGYFTCDLCRVCYPTVQALTDHFKLDHPYQYVDLIDGLHQKKPDVRITYEEIDEFINQNLTHVQCGMCNGHLSTFHDLKEHYKCAHPKSFYRIICCGRKWKGRYDIEEHIIYHKTPEAFCCAECKKTFFCRYNLHKHVRKGHKQPGLVRWEKEKKMDENISGYMENLRCPICHGIFNSFGLLKMHYSEEHRGLKFNVFCCNKSFEHRQSFLKHLSSNHLPYNF
uniref:C2H2-type domain-containing protein n=1 Tax=Musca domestica TaxID=7370 RepID=A0A1I8N1Y5_MUSDO